MNYNPEQIKQLQRYANTHGILVYRLHAYVAEVNRFDDEGYTIAHNADVASLDVVPEDLGKGIDDLLKANPGTDVTISSRVRLCQGWDHHIHMIDFATPAKEIRDNSAPNELPTRNALCDVSNFAKRTVGVGVLDCNGVIYVSGNSYHFYGLNAPPFPDSLFTKVVGAHLVVDSDNAVDKAWLGFSLGRGEFRLRLTANQRKYRHLPTYPEDMPLQPIP